MAAAVSATGLTTALTTGTATVAPVKLAALITPANSTAQIFASSDYYGVNWVQQYGQPQVVPFFLGPQGIVTAIDSNANDPSGIAVLASGWGAGQTSTALALMAASNDPALNNIKTVVLDNNTNRAGGGFWTTYWMFAPLLGTSAAPTPNNLNVPIVDVAYEYNINSDAPTYPIDVLADLNSLAAYIYGYGGQSSARLPNPPGGLQPGTHYVVAPDGTYTTYPATGNITYVTFESDGLPLLRPLQLIPGGNILVDALQPTVTALVDWGYKDNQPIPQDPGVTRPVGLLPSASEDATAIHQLQASVPQGVRAGAAAAQQDVSSPASLVTGPVSEVRRTASIVPNPFSVSTNSVGRNKVSPSTPSTGVRQVAGGVRSALDGPANGLTGGRKPK
jgi:hypothetical protein